MASVGINSVPTPIGAVECRWILKTVMQPASRSKEDRAGLAGAVAHSDDVVEVLLVEFLNGLRAMPGNVNSELMHNRNRFGTD